MNVIHASRLFKTDEFLTNPQVNAICEKVGAVTVRTLKEEKDHRWDAEGHFNTWWGIFTERAYESPYLSDLYTLHELTHIQTLEYDSNATWLQWSQMLIRSEIQASLTSECYVYLNIHGLRMKTFQHPIWVDRFLLNKESHKDIKQKIRNQRLCAMTAPEPTDFLEAQIHNYFYQNHTWCRIMSESVGIGPTPEKPLFRIVNEHMSQKPSYTAHCSWLEEYSTDGIPFLKHKNLFAPVYKESSLKYGNYLLSR
jgi:hypothetical protein